MHVNTQNLQLTCSFWHYVGFELQAKKTHETTDQNETPDQAHGRAEGCSVGRSSHLEGYPAERLSARGDVEVNRGVLVGRSRAAAAQAGSGEGQ